MELSFLENTGVCIVDGILSEEELAEIYELISWADKHGFQLSYSTDDQSMLDNILDSEDHISFWDKRNYSIELYPKRYQYIAQEVLSANADLAFSKYLEAIGRGGEEFRPINLTTFHMLKGGDTIDAHIDCFDYGIVFYVGQSEDIEGGDLHFVKDDIYLPFKANRMLIIPSNIEHEVTEVVSGKRVSSTDFVPVGSGWADREV